MLLFFHFSIYKQKYPPSPNIPCTRTHNTSQHGLPPQNFSSLRLKAPCFTQESTSWILCRCLIIGTTNPNMSGLKPKCTRATFRAIDHRSKFGCRLGLRFDVGVAVCYIRFVGDDALPQPIGFADGGLPEPQCPVLTPAGIQFSVG